MHPFKCTVLGVFATVYIHVTYTLLIFFNKLID